MLECLSAGTTTVVDHAHLTVSPSHVRSAIAATASSGIRSVFCYTPIFRVKSFNPLMYHQNLLEEWVMETLFELAAQGPFGNGRVNLGFAFDLFFLPPEVIKDIFKSVKDAGIKTITTHDTSSPQLGGGWPGGMTQTLKNMDLLDETIILSHANAISPEAADLIKAAGAHVSSTPSTELHMAMGRPVCFDAAFRDGGVTGRLVGIQSNASLGVDCHSNNAGSIISEARLGLQTARNYYNESYLKEGKTTKTLPQSLNVEAAFDLATIKGAEAVRMSREIGQIAEGYRADLVIFDALSPALIGAAQHDPIAAIILHASPADIEAVIVDGIVRKQEGKLLRVEVEQVAGFETKSKGVLEWNDIAMEVVNSRELIQRELEKVDFAEGRQAISKLFHVDEALFVG